MILCIDDDFEILEMYKMLIECINKNICVETFKNPLEAIHFFKLHHNEINLVLSDFQMPEMNGVQLVHELKNINNSISMGIASSLIDDNGILYGYNETPKVDFLSTKPNTKQSIQEILNKFYKTKSLIC